MLSWILEQSQHFQKGWPSCLIIRLEISMFSGKRALNRSNGSLACHPSKVNWCLCHWPCGALSDMIRRTGVLSALCGHYRYKHEQEFVWASLPKTSLSPVIGHWLSDCCSSSQLQMICVCVFRKIIWERLGWKTLNKCKLLFQHHFVQTAVWNIKASVLALALSRH